MAVFRLVTVSEETTLLQEGMKMEDIQTVVNKFLDNVSALDDKVLEAIVHVLEVELRERDFMSNPQNFQTGEDDVN